MKPWTLPVTSPSLAGMNNNQMSLFPLLSFRLKVFSGQALVLATAGKSCHITSDLLAARSKGQLTLSIPPTGDAPFFWTVFFCLLLGHQSLRLRAAHVHILSRLQPLPPHQPRAQASFFCPFPGDLIQSPWLYVLMVPKFISQPLSSRFCTKVLLTYLMGLSKWA